MPLPNVRLGIVPRCRAKSKRSGERCWNLCAHGSATVCRMHGARPREAILCEEKHPNFKHGQSTKKKRNQDAASATKLLLLRDLGVNLGLFGDQPTGWPGRRPKNYPCTDHLTVPELVAAIERHKEKNYRWSCWRCRVPGQSLLMLTCSICWYC